MKRLGIDRVLTSLAILAGVLFCAGKSEAFMQTDYYQAGANTYVCSSTATAPAVNTAGLQQQTTGLILINPPGSNVKMVILDVGIDLTASPAAAAGFFLAGSTMPAVIVSSTIPPAQLGTLSTAYIGLSTGTFTRSQAQCYVYATLPATPFIFRMLGGTTGAAAIGGVQLLDRDYPPGMAVLLPGSMVAIESTSAASFMAHITWIELPQ